MIDCHCGAAKLEPVPWEDYARRSLQTAQGIMGPPPPWHRKRRIRKKWAARYAETKKLTALVAVMMVPAMSGPLGHYRCPKCNATAGGYQVLARSLFPVERMPEGAVSYYGGPPGPEPTPRPPMSAEEKRALLSMMDMNAIAEGRSRLSRFGR
jgi:hypothetical protein